MYVCWSDVDGEGEIDNGEQVEFLFEYEVIYDNINSANKGVKYEVNGKIDASVNSGINHGVNVKASGSIGWVVGKDVGNEIGRGVDDEVWSDFVV